MQPMELRSTRDYVAEQLRKEILSKRLAPGTMIQQESISAQMGVSRTPVREAFQLLEAEGLLERLPTRHIRILGIDDEQMRQILQITCAMEKMTLDMISRQEDFSFRFSNDVDAGVRLHVHLVEQLHNPPIVSVLCRLLKSYVRFAAPKHEEAFARLQSCNRVLNEALDSRAWKRAADAIDRYYHTYLEE